MRMLAVCEVNDGSTITARAMSRCGHAARELDRVFCPVACRRLMQLSTTHSRHTLQQLPSRSVRLTVSDALSKAMDWKAAAEALSIDRLIPCYLF